MPEPTTLHIDRENVNQAVEIGPGFWVIATRHHPGFSRFNPEVNNRCLVFRLHDQSVGNAEVLVVVNAVDPTVLPEVRRLEKETGVPLRYLISPGGGHVVMLPRWHDELPNVQVLVGSARIPRTTQGKQLAASPRFAVFDNRDPLAQFKGELDVVNFDGLLGFREQKTPLEGGKDSAFGLLKVMLTEMPPKDPIDEVWLYHRPTRTVIGGENLGWILSKDQHKSMPLMMRMMMKPEKLYLMSGPRKVADKARVSENWKAILGWPARTAMSYHDTVGTAFEGDAQNALGAAARAAKQI